MNLKRFLPFKKEKQSNKIPIVLWNHRWEYDKNPTQFFKLLFQLQDEGVSFQLIVLGKSYHKQPPIFKIAKERLADRILHFGFANDFATYAQLLWQADIAPVTSNQDFFGGSVVEAIFCNNFPLLPQRLAYPEHIPVTLHPLHLYQNEANLYEKLKAFLTHFPDHQVNTELQNFVVGYDWSNLATEYDQRVAQMIK